MTSGVSSGMRRRALEAAERVDAGEVARLAQALVRIPSHFPGPGEGPVVAFLDGYLRERGFAVTIQEVAPGRPNLIADLGSGEGGLIFEGHADVVAPGDPALWTHPPFAGLVVDGRLYGRGANDMKGGLAAAIVALQAVREALGEPACRLRLAVLADEEGMMSGVKAFVRAGSARGFAGAVICEPEENEICLSQKGALRIRAIFHGRMAHGAMPYAGANPIPAAARFIRLAADVEGILHARPPHPHLGLPYVTPTVMSASAGDGQLNVIPPTAEVCLDVRTIPGTDHGEIVDRLEAAIAEAAGHGEEVRTRLEVIEDRPATETDPDHPLVRAAEEALDLLGYPIRYGGVPGATDGTFLWAWGHLPVLILGPGGRTIPHQVDEYVEVEELLRAARIYAALATLWEGKMRQA